MIVVLLGVAIVAGSAAAARIGFSLQFTGSGNIDMVRELFVVGCTQCASSAIRRTPKDSRFQQLEYGNDSIQFMTLRR